MPKASRGKKKTKKIGTVQQHAPQATAEAQAAVSSLPRVPARRRATTPAATGLQSLVFPGMVALGCWGMAFTLAYFYTDPNRFLFAGMAALMGLFWTYNLYIRYTRIRKMREVK